VEVPLRSVFEEPTVAGFAALVGAAGAGPALPPLLPAGDLSQRSPTPWERDDD
jgi:hypothetical protein